MSSSSASGDGIQIVLVDDQPMVGEAVRRMLSGDASITVDHQLDAAAALAHIEATNPTIVIIDLVMPDIDGIELTRRIRASKSAGDLPIIMLSSESDVHRKVEAFAVGANDFLVKMPDRLELMARVQSLAAKAVAERELRLMAERLHRRTVELDEANRTLQAVNVSLESDVSQQRDRLRSIAMLGNDLSRIQDIDILMERLLTEARTILGADAGGSFIVDGGTLRLTQAQNDSFQDPEVLDRLRRAAVKLPIDESSLVGYVAKTGEVVNVDDAYALDAQVPYTFNPHFDEAYGYQTRSVLAAPLVGSAGQMIGVLQLINPQASDGTPRERFDEDDVYAARHFASMASVSMQNAQLTRSMILRMIRMAELRDPAETGAHANRVAEYALVIYEMWAERHDIEQTELERQRDRLRIAAMLHDVGKVAIPDTILKKPGKLTDEEFAIMQAHTMVGESLFDELLSGYDEAAAIVVRGHHERWDGLGYPGDLRLEHDALGYLIFPSDPIRTGRGGEEIPLFARIVAIADVFDALGSQRSYKDPWPEERILSLLQSEAGSHFDPELVGIFLERIDAIRAIQHKWTPNKNVTGSVES